MDMAIRAGSAAIVEEQFLHLAAVIVDPTPIAF